MKESEQNDEMPLPAPADKPAQHTGTGKIPESIPETASTRLSLRERLRRRKRSIARHLEYKRLKRIRKRTVPAYVHCKNCGETLQGMYCHRCGQYALDIEQPFWKYIRQYFENVYQFDGKIGQTLYLLFRRPGFLTQEFNAGRINSYVHPFRLYMCVSVVFFTVFFMIASSRVDSLLAESQPRNLSETVVAQLQRDSLKRDTAVYVYHAEELKRILGKNGVKNADRIFRIVPLTGMLDIARVEMPRLLLDSCLFTVPLRSEHRKAFEKIRRKNTPASADGTVCDTDAKNTAAPAADNPEEPAAYDWRETSDDNQRLQVRQFKNDLMARVSKWTPFFMLFMLPVFALLTMFAYRKKRLPYMRHFVHAIHINTVFLLLLTVPLGILIATSSANDIYDERIGTYFAVFFAFVFGYMLLSFHRVYKNGWLKTALKTLFVFCTFSLLALAAALGGLVWLVLQLTEKL